MHRAAASLLAVLALAGCGGGDPDPAAETSPALDSRTRGVLADVRRLCGPFLAGEAERACGTLREALADGRVADDEVDAVADAVAALERELEGGGG